MFPLKKTISPTFPIGTLSIDSIFNPVIKASFNIQLFPGAKAPIEILNLNLKTDGSITAKDAVYYSATYLREHLMYQRIFYCGPKCIRNFRWFIRGNNGFKEIAWSNN